MSKYTPGPWKVSNTAHREAGISILSEDRGKEGSIYWEQARVGLNSRKSLLKLKPMPNSSPLRLNCWKH